MKNTLKKIIFTGVAAVLLIAIGAMAYVWFKQNNVVNIKNQTSPSPTGTPNTYISVTEAEPFVGPKPEDDEVVKFPIFNYHHIRPMPPETVPIDERSFTVSPAMFEAHLKYFKDNGYQVVLARDLVRYFDTGEPLLPKAVAITFDDGRYGQYEFAFKSLKKYGMLATFFITTDWIGKKEFMTWPQIKEMADAGMAIGSHAITHPHLAELSDEQLKKELEESKKNIEDRIGQAIDLLAYPGGNYNARVIEFTKKAGYAAAFGVYKIIDQQPKYRYAIRRFHADDNLESVSNKLVGY